MIRLHLLGSVDLLDESGRQLGAALRRSKRVAVLAYLAAARPQGLHRRDKIAALFWPELPTDRARAALRVTLSRLRDDVGPNVIVARGAEEIGVDHAELRCDVVALRDELTAGRPLAAASLYRGEFLDGVHVEGASVELEQWIDAERRRTRDEVVRSLIAANDVAAARRAVEIVPTDDAASRQLIKLLRAAGEADDALRVYDTLVRELARDLELEPSAETASLVRDLRDGPHGSRPPSPSGASLAVKFPPPPARMSPSRMKLGYVAAGGMAAVVMAGAALSRSRVPLRAASPDPLHWTINHTDGSRATPRPRLSARAVLDSSGDGLLLFGGNLYGEDIPSSRLLNDLWRYRRFHDGELPEWTRLTPEGDPPSPRWLMGATYDRAHDRLVVHGGALGFTSPCASDTWVLDHASGVGASPRWRQVRLTGTPPTPRAGMDVVFDAAHRRLIRFGGHDCVRTFDRDVWVLAFDDSTLSTGTWRRLAPDSAVAPPGRSAYASTYDAASNRLFVHGGYHDGVIFGDLWYLDHANGDGGAPSWHSLRCDGTQPALHSHAAAYDSVADVWVISGGADSSNTDTRDVWRVTGLRDVPARCRWDLLHISGPTPNARRDHSAMYDPAGRALIIEGGSYEGTAFRDVHVLKGAFTR